MRLFLLVAPLIGLTLFPQNKGPKAVHWTQKVKFWLHGFLWTYFLTLFYWMWRIRDQNDFELGPIFLSYFVGEFLLFWGPNLALYFVAGRRYFHQPWSLAWWLGGLTFFLSLRDALILPSGSQLPELIIVPLYRVIAWFLFVEIYRAAIRGSDPLRFFAFSLLFPMLWAAVSAAIALSLISIVWPFLLGGLGLCLTLLALPALSSRSY